MTARLRVVVVLGVLALVAAAVPVSAARAGRLPAPWPDGAVPGRLLVTTSATVDADALLAALPAALRPPGARAVHLARSVARIDIGPGTEAAAADWLRLRPGVVAVEPVGRLQRRAVPNDPEYARQWAHRRTGAELAWETTTGSEDVLVAVADDGIDATHPELADAVVAQVDTSDGTAAVLPTGTDNDPCQTGHGTEVAGVVGAAGDDGRGVAGVAWRVSLLDLRVFSPERGCGGVADDAIIAAVHEAADRGADVLNISLGRYADACPAAYQAALDDARAAGVLVVAAVGNDQQAPGLRGASSVPSSCDGVLAVGAADRSGDAAGYSVADEGTDLVAPGGDSTVDADSLVVTTARGGGTTEVEGTSFAAPYVAGVAALVLAVAPDLAPDAVESVLERSAEDRGPAGRDPEQGWGLVRADAAVARATSSEATRPPEPDPPFPVEGPPAVARLDAGTARTEPVPQAVAVSRAVFADGAATHAVLARADDHADALGGSALGYGTGPLLFTASEGPLARATAQELTRALPRGATVYVLGGVVAVPASVPDELRALGFEPVRLGGEAREETAAAVADEVVRLVPRPGGGTPRVAILATRGDWADAVTAGAIAARHGTPVLLTDPGSLHPATAEALRRLDLDGLYVVGGTAVVSEATAASAARAAGVHEDAADRLAGGERGATAVAVAHELIGLDGPPPLVVAVNLRRADGFAHVLSASSLVGSEGGVFVPVDGEGGTELGSPARDLVRGLGIDGVLAGGPDLLGDDTARVLADLLGQG